MKKKVLSLLVLLMTAATGAWAQGYNVSFSGLGGGWCPTVNVASFPQTFTQIGNTQLYPWTVVDLYAEEFVSVSVTNDGNGMVSASKTSWDHMSITVSGTFEGTATIHVEVTMEEAPNASTDITVTCVENVPTVAVTSVTLPSSSASLTEGEKVALTATVAPDNATDKKVKWTVGGTDAGAVKLYTDEACETEVGTSATSVPPENVRNRIKRITLMDAPTE